MSHQPYGADRESPLFVTVVEERTLRSATGATGPKYFFVRYVPGPFTAWARTEAEADAQAAAAMAAMRKHLAQTKQDEFLWWQGELSRMSGADRALYDSAMREFPPRHSQRGGVTILEAPRRTREVEAMYA